jgi:hypothetical protein
MNYPEDKEEVKKEGAHEKPTEVHAVRYKRYDEKTIQEFEDETNKLLSDTYKNIQKKYNSK